MEITTLVISVGARDFLSQRPPSLYLKVIDSSSCVQYHYSYIHLKDSL